MTPPPAVEPLFLAPLRIELLALRRGAPGAEVRRIGMGPARATAARASLESTVAKGRPLVLLGFGGALTADLRPGDLVVASTLGAVGSDDTFLLPDARAVARLLELAAPGVRVRHAPVVCSSRVLRGDEARVQAASHGAVAVEMESLWCAPLARRHPFVVVRAIVDVPGREFVSAATPVAAWRAFCALASAARALAHWTPATVNDNPLMEVGDI
ncbi:MAG TPA: hypothetical protein VMU75_09420 [Acidimicrobiales bacterium]|nr:hypothetical protein [Acidimicrobiales bacterium]